jgi:hypothetical protein
VIAEVTANKRLRVGCDSDCERRIAKEDEEEEEE